MMLRRLFTTLIPTAGLMLAATADANLSEVAHPSGAPAAPLVIEQPLVPGPLSEVAHQPRQQVGASAVATREATGYALSEVTTQPPQKPEDAAQPAPRLVASNGSARASR